MAISASPRVSRRIYIAVQPIHPWRTGSEFIQNTWQFVQTPNKHWNETWFVLMWKKERKMTSMLPPAWLWCCFIYELVWIICNPQTGITRIRLLLPFEGDHLEWAHTSRPAPIFPQAQVPRFPHGWLKTSHLPGYPTMIGFDHRWLGAPEIKC